MKACTRCGRNLKDQKSIEREFGPKCWKKHLKAQEEIGFKENQVTIDEVEGAE